MSRVGKLPISVPSGVVFDISDKGFVTVKGQKGVLNFTLALDLVSCTYDNEKHLVSLSLSTDTQKARAHWGLSRSILNNMINGVSKGFTINLELVGVGYKAALMGKHYLVLSLGYSDDIIYAIPEGIEVACEKQTRISVSGCDKQFVGQIASEIRALRPPEPYKGKGIRYVGEEVRMKEGKKK